MGLSINKQKLINQECHTTIVTLSSSAIKEKKIYCDNKNATEKSLY